MRIALIGPVPPFRGGIAHYTSQLSLALTAAGHDLLLVSFKRQYPRWLFPGASDRDASQQQIETIQAQFWLDSLNPFTWFTTFWRIHRSQPDLIILPWWTVFWAPAWFVLGALNRLFGASTLVLLCHNVLPHDSSTWQRIVTKLVFRWADRFVVQSPTEMERLQSLFAHAQVAVVPHPVYQMIEKSTLDKAMAREHLGIDPSRPVLLFFGMVRPYKGLDILLAAMPDVCAEIPDTLLVVAGEFWEDPTHYQTQIETLGIGSSVRVDNRYIPNEAVALLFTAADLVVAPYRHVTGSGVIQLAKGFGVPVVASGTIMQDDGVQLVPVEDPVSLAATIVRSLRSPITPPVAVEDAGWGQLVGALVGR